MAPGVCIYTALCGGYDTLKPQCDQTVACDFVCFTDDPNLSAVASWRVELLDTEATEGLSARLKSRYAKALPHEVLGPTGYEVAIWIDASVQILRSTFAETMIAAIGASGLATIEHPDRDCIYAEAEMLLDPASARRGGGLRIREQVEHYRKEGYPEHNGLAANGVLARRMADERVQRVDAAWWEEIRRWSVRDQLSLPYVLWKLGAPLDLVRIPLWRNHLFAVWPHLEAGADEMRLRTAAARPIAAALMHPDADRLGAYVRESGAWRLDDGRAARRFTFGPAGRDTIAFMGDWDGDGESSPGIYDRETGTFFLRNSCDDGPADHSFAFGSAGAHPVVGDWNGDGRDTVGVYIPWTGMWALTNRLEPGRAEMEFSFGAPDAPMLAVAGDWDGRGRDRVGLHDPSHASWFLLDELGTGERVSTFCFGPERGMPIAGDWNGDGTDTVGTFVPEQAIAWLADTNGEGAGYGRVLVDPVGSRPVVWRRSRRA